jgi:hypothetical protein
MRAVEHPLEFVNALPAFLGWPYAPYGWWPGHRRKPARSRYAWCRDVLPAKGGAGLNISDLRERNGIVNLPRGRRAEVGWSQGQRMRFRSPLKDELMRRVILLK